MTVKQVQCLLAYLGYDPGGIDGVTGPKTTAAVKAFQASEGLKADGVAGTLTWSKLLDAVAQGRVYQSTNTSASPDQTDTGDGPAWWADIKHFKRSEPYIACPCGRCGGFPAEPAEKLMRLADKVRDAADRPMVPTSTVRCDAHNAAVGGVATSRHRLGHAMDFYIPGLSAAQTLAIVRKQPEVVYTYAIDDRCVHMDIGN